jgi:hypothetical protein
MSVTINTAKAHQVRTLGDLTLILTWVNGERALVLLPTYRKGAPWYVVCESAAWRYADDPAYLARSSIRASKVLDMPGQAARIGGVIYDHLTDLRRMPPEPAPGKASFIQGNAKVSANGQVIGECDMRPDKVAGIEFGA